MKEIIAKLEKLGEDKFAKELKKIYAGTWEVPFTLKKATALYTLLKTIKSGKTTVWAFEQSMHKLLGDDSLFDDLNSIGVVELEDEEKPKKKLITPELASKTVKIIARHLKQLMKGSQVDSNAKKILEKIIQMK